MLPVWQTLSSIFGGGFDRTCVRPLNLAFYDATGRYAVRKTEFTSVQKAASARTPGLNFPALNFEVGIAYSSSIAHPAFRPCRALSLFGFRSCHSLVLLLCRNCPDHASHLVRQGNGRNHLWLARHKCSKPAIRAAAFAAASAYYAHVTDDQQA